MYANQGAAYQMTLSDESAKNTRGARGAASRWIRRAPDFPALEVESVPGEPAEAVERVDTQAAESDEDSSAESRSGH